MKEVNLCEHLPDNLNTVCLSIQQIKDGFADRELFVHFRCLLLQKSQIELIDQLLRGFLGKDV